MLLSATYTGHIFKFDKHSFIDIQIFFAKLQFNNNERSSTLNYYICILRNKSKNINTDKHFKKKESLSY
jgi:hypothetical protein